MSKQNLIFPTTKLLPMENMAEELKTIHNFQLNTESSIDTKAVGGVKSEFIATVATDEEGNPIQYKDGDKVLIGPRESVKNSEYLGGLPAEHYLSTNEGANIRNFGEQVSHVFSDEVAALRDELYQLIGELSRSGHIQERGVYAGFQDFFKKSNKKYIYGQKTEDGETIDTFKVCGLAPGFYDAAANITRVVLDKAGLIKVGDWFVIHKTDNNENYLVQATKVEKVNTYDAVTFTSLGASAGIPSISDASEVEIWKVLGDYINGTFSYSKVEEFATTNKERVTMLNDDSVTGLQAITKDQSGFAATFKVPNNMNGALNYFSINARSVGNPGALTCYIVQEEDLSSITDLKDELIQNKIIAKSKPVAMTSSSNILNELKFQFENPYTYKKVILESKRYAFIVVSETCTADDRWELQFSRSAFNSSNPDVQTNNKTYTYESTVGLTGASSYGDVIFSLSVMEVKENHETPMTSGLYSSRKIEVPYNEPIARARLTMRVNREGLYEAVTEGNITDNGILTFKSSKEDPGSTPGNHGFGKGDIVVIGNQIRHVVEDCNNTNLTLDKAIAINGGDDLYRVGYKVYLRGHKKTWKTEGTIGYVTTEDVVIPLELKAVMKDDFKLNETYSDRLVFEGEFRNEDGSIIDCNEFYLQVLWKSNVQKTSLISNKDYIGRIYDLNLTFDRTI